eukprot:2450218-Amphidinium_carterae.1
MEQFYLIFASLPPRRLSDTLHFHMSVGLQLTEAVRSAQSMKSHTEYLIELSVQFDVPLGISTNQENPKQLLTNVKGSKQI